MGPLLTIVVNHQALSSQASKDALPLNLNPVTDRQGRTIFSYLANGVGQTNAVQPETS